MLSNSFFQVFSGFKECFDSTNQGGSRMTLSISKLGIFLSNFLKSVLSININTRSSATNKRTISLYNYSLLTTIFDELLPGLVSWILWLVSRFLFTLLVENFFLLSNIYHQQEWCLNCIILSFFSFCCLLEQSPF